MHLKKVELPLKLYEKYDGPKFGIGYHPLESRAAMMASTFRNMMLRLCGKYQWLSTLILIIKFPVNFIEKAKALHVTDSLGCQESIMVPSARLRAVATLIENDSLGFPTDETGLHSIGPGDSCKVEKTLIKIPMRIGQFWHKRQQRKTQREWPRDGRPPYRALFRIDFRESQSE